MELKRITAPHVTKNLLRVAACLALMIVAGARGEEPLFPVGKDQLYGYIDRSGAIRIKLQFTFQASFFREGLATVGVRDTLRQGFINTKREMFIEPKFVDARDFADGLARVQEEWKSRPAFIDRSGRIVFRESADLQSGMSFSEGLRAVGDGNAKWGYIDTTGRIAIAPRFDQPGDFSEGLADVQIDGRVQYIDKSGEIVLTLPYEYSRGFSEGMVAVFANGKWGYADRSGKPIIQLRFDNAEDFSEGLAAVAIGTKWGVIDKNGDFVIPPKFDGMHRNRSPIEPFTNGLARVSVDDEEEPAWPKKGYIDRTGKYIWEPTN